jgi:hypothetical protein
MPKSVLDFDIRGSGGLTELYLPEQNAQRIQQTDVALNIKTGWSNSPGVTLSFVDGTRTFTITPDSSSFEYWIQGVKYVKTSAESVVIDPTEGLWYIYYVGTTLTASQTPWAIRDADKCFVAIVHWDNSNSVGMAILYECHSYNMLASTHNYLHETIGTNFESGLAITVGSGGTEGQIGLTEGELHDEDIEIVITDGGGGALFEQVLTLPAQIPIYYRSGASAWRKYAVTNFPFYDNAGGDNVHYNAEAGGSYSSTAASSSAKYIAYWIFGTNDISQPIVSLMGQFESNTLNIAKEVNILSNYSFGVMPFPEMKILYRLIFKSDSTHAHTEDMRSVDNVPGGTYVPTPTPDLDAVCSVGSEYDGATSLANAVIFGDGTNVLNFHVAGGEGFFSSDVAINILPSGDIDDYIQISTAGDVPQISFVGGNGLITNVADPTNPQDVSTKAYNDLFLLLAGGEMTGNITMAGAETVDGVDISAFKTAYDAHLHNTQTLQLDGINSDGGAFSFSTTGAITFNQNLAFTGAQTVDGVDVSAIAITSMPTAGNNWKVHYTNGSGVMTEVALGASGEVLMSNGASSAPTFQTAGGGALPTPAHILLLMDGFAWDFNRASVAHSDTNARFLFNFTCPETSSSWYIAIYHYSTVSSRTDGGGMYLGAQANNESVTNNIYNNSSTSLVNTTAGRVYVTTKGPFSATEGDLLHGRWQKNNNPGTGNLYIYGAYIYIA